MPFKAYEEEKYGLHNKAGEWRDAWVIHSRIKLGQNRIVFEIRHYYVKLSVGIAGSCVGLTIYPGVWYILIGTHKLGVYIFELLIRKESKHMPMQKKNSSRKIKDYRKPTIFFYRRAFFFLRRRFFFSSFVNFKTTVAFWMISYTGQELNTI